MRYIFVHSGLPAEIKRCLSFFGACIVLPPFQKLPHPVSSHPDMLMANIEGTLFIHEEYTEGQKLLTSLGIPFSLSHTPVEKDYPKDVRLNCFSLGKYLFANEKAVSEDILHFAVSKSMKLVSVKQGYAKCATALAGGTVVTADKSIYKAALREKIPSLLLAPHHIDIEKYDTGFIGGACVSLADKLLFFGRIEDYPQYAELRDFFAKHGVTLVSLGEKEIFDYGGAVVYDF